MNGMATTATGQLAGVAPQKPTHIEIDRVENGLIVSGYGIGRKIANTLPEALALAGKELE